MLPYSLPEKVEPNLALVRAYWESLKRGENVVPFWDDVMISSLPDLADTLLLIDAFEEPERFRFSFIGHQLQGRYGGEISNHFTDEIELRNPFEYLTSQCGATVEGRTPTYYRHVATAMHKIHASESYARILLPLWGEGRIRMLLGAIVSIKDGTAVHSDRVA